LISNHIVLNPNVFPGVYETMIMFC